MSAPDQFGKISPIRLAAQLGAAVAVLFLLGMGAIFHFVQVGNRHWALVWWWITAGGTPASLWISWRLLRAYHQHREIAAADIVQPIAVALAFMLIGTISAFWFYG